MTLVDTHNRLIEFTPNEDNTRTLRDAFGRFATGVTIVTVNSEDGPIGITANSFTSLSLTPPLVLWAPDKGSRRFSYFREAKHFAIHVLGADQSELCWRIAKDKNGLANEPLTFNPENVPLLDGSLARFECTRHAVHDGGDHEIIVGRILRAGLRKDGDPLAFFKGKMSRFTS